MNLVGNDRKATVCPHSVRPTVQVHPPEPQISPFFCFLFFVFVRSAECPAFPNGHVHALFPLLFFLSLQSSTSGGGLHLLGFLLLMLSGFSVDSSAAFFPEIVSIPLLFSLLVLGFGSSGLLLPRLVSWQLSSNAEVIPL